MFTNTFFTFLLLLLNIKSSIWVNPSLIIECPDFGSEMNQKKNEEKRFINKTEYTTYVYTDSSGLSNRFFSKTMSEADIPNPTTQLLF